MLTLSRVTNIRFAEMIVTGFGAYLNACEELKMYSVIQIFKTMELLPMSGWTIQSTKNVKVVKKEIFISKKFKIKLTLCICWKFLLKLFIESS